MLTNIQKKEIKIIELFNDNLLFVIFNLLVLIFEFNNLNTVINNLYAFIDYKYSIKSE